MRKIKKGDTVKVMRGKDAGKEGEVLRILRSEKTGKSSDKVIVKGVNVVKKHQKPNQTLGVVGGIYEFEKGIDISNVMILDGGKVSRVGFEIDAKTGKKSRIVKKTKNKLSK